jgi:hypothetical protein
VVGVLLAPGVVMAEAHMERKERVKALGYRLSAEILEHILSFEPYPIHPVAVLIKPLRISYTQTTWMPEPNLTMTVHGPSIWRPWPFTYLNFNDDGRRQLYHATCRTYRRFFVTDMYDSDPDPHPYGTTDGYSLP